MYRGLAVVMAMLAAHLGGCSALFVNSVPPGGYERLEEVDCIQSGLAPVVDTLHAAYHFIPAAYILGYMLTGGEHWEIGLSLSIPLLYAGTGVTVSAVHGYSETAKCREEVERLQSPPRVFAPESLGRELDPTVHFEMPEANQPVTGPPAAEKVPMPEEPDGVTRVPSGSSEAPSEGSAVIHAPWGNSEAPAESATEAVPTPDDRPR